MEDIEIRELKKERGRALGFERCVKRRGDTRRYKES